MNPLMKLRVSPRRAAFAALGSALFLAVALSLASPEWYAPAADDANTAQTLNAPGGRGNESTLKKIVAAPVRLFARMFRRDDRRQAKRPENYTLKPGLVLKDGVDAPNPAAEAIPAATNAERAAALAFDQALALHEKRQLDAAVSKLVAAVALHPNYAEAYNLLGVCYDEQGRYSLAQEEYKKAVKLEPVNARFLNNLGYSYYLAGDDKQAVKYYQKALRFTPDDKRIFNNLGLAYGRRGDFGKARESFVKAVGEQGARLNLGYIYSQQGRYQQAIEQFEAALYAQPNSLVAVSSLAQLYDRVGRVREAAMLGEQYKRLSAGEPPRDQTAEQKSSEKDEK
jgi:Flp pilus assembly protein TadD